MDSGRAREREMIKIADHAPKSILRNVYSNENADERSPSRMASGSGLSRHRVGVSPGKTSRDGFCSWFVVRGWPSAKQDGVDAPV